MNNNFKAIICLSLLLPILLGACTSPATVIPEVPTKHATSSQPAPTLTPTQTATASPTLMITKTGTARPTSKPTSFHSTLGFNIESINLKTGYVRINGGDSRRPSHPFSINWGDGHFEESFFAMEHTYADPTRNYELTITAHYLEAGILLQDSRSIMIPFLPCPATGSRLTIGGKARVIESLHVRSAPKVADNILQWLEEGMKVKILSGPACSGGVIFWEVSNDTIPGGSGWAAEGDGTDYWLEPY